MRFDGFDSVLLFFGIALIGGAAVLGLGGNAGTERSKAAAPDAFTRQELDRAAGFLALQRPLEARDLLRTAAWRNPGVAEAHVLLGRALVELEDYPASVCAFRAGLGLDPDFADPKSGKYAGKAIRRAIAGDLDAAKRGLPQAPSGPAAKSTLRDAHYLERMLAGGCE